MRFAFAELCLALLCFGLLCVSTLAVADPSALVLRRNDGIDFTLTVPASVLGEKIVQGGPGRIYARAHEIRYAIEGLRLTGDELTATSVSVTIFFPTIELQAEVPEFALRNGRLDRWSSWRTVGQPLANQALTARLAMPRLRLCARTEFEVVRATPTTMRLRFTRPQDIVDSLRRAIDDSFTDAYLNGALSFDVSTFPQGIRPLVALIVNELRSTEERRRASNNQIRAAIRDAVAANGALGGLEIALTNQLPVLALAEGRRLPGELALTNGTAAYSTLRVGTGNPDTLRPNGEALVVALNAEAMNVAAPIMWPQTTGNAANEQQQNEFAAVLSALHNAPVAANRIQSIRFAPIANEAPVTFLGNPRRLRLRVNVVAQGAANTPPAATVPVTVVASIQDGAAVIDRVEGAQGNAGASQGLQRLQLGLQMGLLRLVINQNLLTAQRERRLTSDFIDELNQGGPYLVVRLR